MKVYVVTHKQFTEPPYDIIYEPLLVGANSNKAEYSLKDNTGDNISSKNGDYCELTGQYWIWKNSKYEIVGLTHYRRYFFDSKSNIITKKLVERLLNKYDIIIANKHYLTKSILRIYQESPLLPYLNEMLAILERDYPKYYLEFKKVLQRKVTYPYNMMICNKDIFDSYTMWLFEVLSKVENKINEKIEKKIIEKVPRAYGYLSENLLITYIIVNNLNYKTLPVYNVEDNPFREYFKNKEYFLVGLIKTILFRD